MLFCFFFFICNFTKVKFIKYVGQDTLTNPFSFILYHIRYIVPDA